MKTLKQAVRWTPVAYYAVATAWNGILGGVDLQQVFVLIAAASCYFFLAQASEWNLSLVNA